MKIKKISFIAAWLILSCLTTATAFAQTSAFSYQGRLTDGGTPANGTYEIQFTLWDTNAGGTQQPQPAPVIITRANVQVSAGAFTVQPLDFGSVAFPGADRYLEISVRRNAGDPFTTLSPRQQITSTPYAIRSLTAATADTATNATQLGGVDAARFVQSDAGGNVNIAGGLIVGGSFSLDTVNAQTQYNLGGQRILANAGNSNLFVGIGAGTVNSAGFNTFVGNLAGTGNTTGESNAFFGNSSGRSNTNGQENAFFGADSGSTNVAGSRNAFFGFSAGAFNTADNNAFFGYGSGYRNTAGSGNSIFGYTAGFSNTTGDFNAFFGAVAGGNNTTGKENAFFGDGAGAGNVTGSNNTFVGRQAGLNNAADNNSFFGHFAGQANTTGGGNSLFGVSAGVSNTSGAGNSFFGQLAGGANTSGNVNSFFGINAGYSNTTGSNNSFFGDGAGSSNTTGQRNSFFGDQAGALNVTGSRNAFFGVSAGLANTAADNAFFGGSTGLANTTGSNNSFFGNVAGMTNTTGTHNTLLGFQANVGANNLTNANAIGANAFVSTSNSMVLGSISGVNGAIADTNVGIGTAAPQTRLQVQTATGVYGFTHTDGAVTVGTYVGSSSSGAFGGWLGTQSNHKLFFFTGNGQPTMTVDTTGNVGIGASTPASKLTVAGLIETTTGGVKFPDGTIQTTAGGGVGSGVTSLNGLTNNVLLAAGSNITITPAGNTLTIASTGGSGGILNQTTQQLSANFNIDGNGTANIFNAGAQFNLGGNRILSATGPGNFFAGFGAGQNNVPGAAIHDNGTANVFVGPEAGQANTLGSDNAFFGRGSGAANIFGGANSFLGSDAGSSNTNGSFNSFFGFQSGQSNLSGGSNAFFGNAAGHNNTVGSANVYVGESAGYRSTDNNNTYVGYHAADNMVGGEDNTAVGRLAGGSTDTFFASGTSNTFIGARAQMVGSGLTFASAIGAFAQVSQGNSLVLGNLANPSIGLPATKVGIGTTAPKATLDVTGGNILVGTPGQGIILKSPDGATCKLLSIDNAGAMVLLATPCP